MMIDSIAAASTSTLKNMVKESMTNMPPKASTRPRVTVSTKSRPRSRAMAESAAIRSAVLASSARPSF